MKRWELEEYMSLSGLFVKALTRNRRREMEERKVQYGDHSQQQVIIVCPKEGEPVRNKVIYFVHGGGWSMGSPGMHRFVGHFFAAMGYPVILAGYRLVPAACYPAQLDDVCLGLAAGIDHCKQTGLYHGQVIAVGHSAGAHLAALMAYKQDALSAHGLEQGVFTGLVLISGVLSLTECKNPFIKTMIDDFLGHSPQNRADADPIRYVTGDETIPVLCFHGDRDPWVERENSLSFHEKVNSGGRQMAKLVLAASSHHTELLDMFMMDSDSTVNLKKWLEEL